MIIEQITIKNWRGYREPHTFHFQDGINLLVGRNEAGKSTLFESLTRVLFDRHNSKTEEIRAIQPIGSSLGPEAQIQFRANGQRYRAVKRFLQDARSELYSERGGSWELDHEGDAADAQLREILRGEATSRTAARSEHRGLAQALWYLQSDGAIPDKTWNNGVKQGLGGLVPLATRSPIETAVLERVKASYSEHWTPTGRIVASSDLARLQSELPKLEERLAGLLEKAKSVESYRSDLEEIQGSESEKRTELDNANAELTASSERVQAAEAYERDREAKERAKSEAEEKARRLRQDLSKIEDTEKKILALRSEIGELDETLSEAAADIKMEATARDRHARRWKEELEPGLKQLETELQALHALERLRKLEKDRDRLEKHLEKVSQIEAQLEARRKERAELVSPSDKDWKRFGTVSKQLSVLQAQVEASAIRVAFEWTNKSLDVRTSPRLSAAEEDEYIVTEPTEFEIENVGKIRVRSDAASLKDLVAERDKVQQEFQQFLTRFGVADADGIATLHEKGRDLDRDIATLVKSLDEAEAAEPDAKDEIARVKRGIEEETRGVSALQPETRKKSGQWVRDEIAAKEREKKQLVREIDDEQKAEKAALQKHLDLVGARETTSNQLAGHKAEIKTHEEGVTAILKTYSTVEHLRELVERAGEEAKITAADLETLLGDYAEKVETPRLLHEQAQRRVQELERQVGDLRTKIAETRARIEEAAAQGNYSQLADTEIEIEWKRRRIEVLKRRADGAKLLHDLVLAHDKQRSAALSGPVQEIVNRWLRLLTEDNYDVLQIDQDLKPAGVRVARYSADLPLTSLSHGAQEQTVVLLRLAIAVLVSSAECNLVVIDDRLVNADPIRMKRLCLILQEAAKACQIVIATCNDTPYAGLGARIVRVPGDGVAMEGVT
ncbi:MAG: hypothetical protein AMXMBFR84_42770 [Candidatus Hydrogenedentota bacterium]